MSGRRTSGTSRPSLGAQVLAVFSSFPSGKGQFKKCLGKRLEVPDILLPDIRGLPNGDHGVVGGSTWPIGCDTPSPFSEQLPVGEHAKCVRYPLCDTISKGCCAIWVRHEKGTQTQTFESGYFLAGWGSSTRRGGGQKVRYVPRHQGNQTFLAGYPGILLEYPGSA